MKIGIFADTHDHLDHLTLAVEHFNRAACELVVFAGDFVSPIVIPPLRKLNCPVLASYGDNEGNKPGIAAGFRIVGTLGEPPFGFETPDGTKILVTHILNQVTGFLDEAQVIIFAHTHRPSVKVDEDGRLFLNPGETSGWSFRNPTIALLETPSLQAEIIPLLPEAPSVSKTVDPSSTTSR